MEFLRDALKAYDAERAVRKAERVEIDVDLYRACQELAQIVTWLPGSPTLAACVRELAARWAAAGGRDEKL